MLVARLRELDPVALSRIPPNNRRRVIRALEVTIGSGRPFSAAGPGLGVYPPTPFVMAGLRLGRDALAERIRARYRAQLDAGFLDEVRALAAVPGGPSRTAAEALGYRELLAHLRGECSLDDAVATAAARTRRFAVRQERWFRRDPRIRWFDVADRRRGGHRRGVSRPWTPCGRNARQRAWDPPLPWTAAGHRRTDRCEEPRGGASVLRLTKYQGLGQRLPGRAVGGQPGPGTGPCGGPRPLRPRTWGWGRTA